MRLDPQVIEQAMQATGTTSLDEFGWKYLNKSGQTIRNYLNGKTTPNAEGLMVLKQLTGWQLGEMILVEGLVAA